MKKILFSGAVLTLLLSSCSSAQKTAKKPAEAGDYINTITAAWGFLSVIVSAILAWTWREVFDGVCADHNKISSFSVLSL